MDLAQEVRIEQHKKGVWDFTKTDEIPYFDPNYSYELSGYRPITENEGLDFNPDWFTDTRKVYQETGHYCPYLPGSKRYEEFWIEQYKRCKYGYTVKGYTLTGDHYFFLNFYQLPVLDKNKKAGAGLDEGFPKFFVSQYKFFHYLELARCLHKHAILMKARGIGFSEINASVAATMYTIRRQSMSMIACYNDNFLTGTFKKLRHALTFLNNCTDGGMSNLELVSKELNIKSGFQKKNSQGQFVVQGWQSEVLGINASDPRNIRGARVDLLIMDEMGSWPKSTTAFIQAQALCEVQGIVRGNILGGGTGGDSGPALEGLNHIYYHPEAYNVLPYRHSFTADNTTICSGFFIPYYEQSLDPDYMDNRGVCRTEDYKKVLQIKRDKLLSNPSKYAEHCAEFCWNAEEAFALEGDNKFNKFLISNQLAKIKLHKEGPRPESGRIEFQFQAGAKKDYNHVTGYRWIPCQDGPIKILEHPRWSEIYQNSLPENSREEVYREMRDMYVAGIDGIDIGANDTSAATRDPSKFCMVIKRRAYGLSEPQIVCLYKDRPKDVREAFKTAICLAKYYNCKINLEATRQSLLTWAREHQCLHLFMKRPRATLNDIKYGSTKQYGTPATKQIIEMHTDLTAAFVEDYCDGIWFEEILDELNRYNDANKTKFDIIAALGMTELADQELSGRKPLEIEEKTDDVFQDFGYYTDEYGHKRFGIIPQQTDPRVLINTKEYYDDIGRGTSDPRLREVLDKYGIRG